MTDVLNTSFFLLKSRFFKMILYGSCYLLVRLLKRFSWFASGIVRITRQYIVKFIQLFYCNYKTYKSRSRIILDKTW